ncbi:MAG: glycosyltransferase [Acidimicrobiales bacterium]
MARIVVVTWAGGGNVPPAVTLATQLAARGHDVWAIGTEALAPRFAADGIRFVPRELLTEWDPAALARDVLAEARKADLVVADYMLPAALSAGEAAGTPVVALVHTLYAANLDGAGGLHPMGMAGSIESLATVRARLGVPPASSFGEILDRCASVMVTSPESLDRPSPDRPDHVRYVGPLLEPAGPDAGWRPPGVDDGRPLVVAGLGTTPMDELPVLQHVVTALAVAPVRGIVTLGDHLDRSDLDAPGGVQLSGYVRHAAMLPWASAVVTHAGLGTVLAGLSHSLPLVCLPLGREQPANAEAVARVGAGVVVDPGAPSAVIAAAIERAVSDLELRAGAARMAVAIDELVQSQAAVMEVERHL